MPQRAGQEGARRAPKAVPPSDSHPIWVRQTAEPHLKKVLMGWDWCGLSPVPSFSFATSPTSAPLCSQSLLTWPDKLRDAPICYWPDLGAPSCFANSCILCIHVHAAALVWPSSSPVPCVAAQSSQEHGCACIPESCFCVLQSNLLTLSLTALNPGPISPWASAACSSSS